MNTQNKNTLITISYELLLLLQWLAIHEESKLKTLIQKSLKNGLRSYINQQTLQNESIEQIKYQTEHHIIEFLNLIELLLHQTLAEPSKNHTYARLHSLTHQIDGSEKQSETVLQTIENVSKHLHKNPDASLKETFMLEFIKKWKPHDKVIN